MTGSGCGITDWNSKNSRLSGRLGVACELSSGRDSEIKFMDRPVPLEIDTTEVYRMVSSRSISMWVFYLRGQPSNSRGV